jgi:tetratricopeptide (TPR) repeat protein
VLEAGGELEAMQTLAVVPYPVRAVPASLHASLMARLDRLGPAKEVAQIGAAIAREFSHGLLAALVHKGETELTSSLDRLNQAGLLFRKGLPPHATYLFKHALVQEAAYGTLLRQPRRALHARIAETIESQFADIAESQPDLLARHYAEAGLIDRAASLCGKAGLRSLERSALVEAIEQLSRALDQIATLPSRPALRREEIKLQVALINPLQHVKGLAAPEAKAAAERARLLIEQAEALGEPPEDPQLLFSVLTALWAVDVAAFDGDRVRERAGADPGLAEKQRAKAPLVGSDGLVGFPHLLMGVSLVLTGNFVEGLVHLDQAIKLYDPVEYRSLAKRTWIIEDQRVGALMYRSLALFALGYPEAALAATEQALSEARETGDPTSLLNALTTTALIQLFSGNYALAKAQSDELIVLAEEKGSISWKSAGMMNRAYVLTLMGKPADAVATFASANGAKTTLMTRSRHWCL